MAEIDTRGILAEDGAKASYNRLTNDRAAYITRAENNAALTVPTVFPKDSDDGSTDYTQPWQSVGARGVNNMANRMMMTSFPLEPWFKLNVNSFALKELSEDPETAEEVEKVLGQVERTMMTYMDSNGYRPMFFEAEMLLIITGNCLLHIPPPSDNPEVKATPKCYSLHNYVVQRDAYDNVLQIITEDKVAYAALPEDVRKGIKEQGDMKPDTEIEVYTHVYLSDEGDKYFTYQEVDGEMVSGTEGEYPLGSLPWIPVRLKKMSGEHYGRSYCDDWAGDLSALDQLTEDFLKFTRITSKVVGLVNPAGITHPKRITKAQTGDFVAGRKGDIEFLQTEKTNDYNVVRQTIEMLEQRLSFGFLLNSAVQRDADRVTAEEIRYVARELEATTGGLYAVQSQEFQLPLVKVILNQLQDAQIIPELPEGAIEPAVSTGLEAIGRGQDLQRLAEFIEVVTAMKNLEGDEDINIRTLKMRIVNALGIDSDGLLVTAEELQQRKAQEAADAAMMQAGQSGGAAMGQQMAQDPEMMQQMAQQATGM